MLALDHMPRTLALVQHKNLRHANLLDHHLPLHHVQLSSRQRSPDTSKVAYTSQVFPMFSIALTEPCENPKKFLIGRRLTTVPTTLLHCRLTKFWYTVRVRVAAVHGQGQGWGYFILEHMRSKTILALATVGNQEKQTKAMRNSAHTQVIYQLAQSFD